MSKYLSTTWGDLRCRSNNVVALNINLQGLKDVGLLMIVNIATFLQFDGYELKYISTVRTIILAYNY
jgi:hypothetical protein